MTEQRKSLTVKFAAKYNMESGPMLKTLKQTAFRISTGEVTNEQMAALLVVANEYNLNPFTKEIYAFPDKGGIVPIVGIDGWYRIINDHPMFNGMEFEFSESVITPKDGKPCPEWITCIIYRKDRNHPTKITEYLDEVYQGPRGKYSGPWQSHTKRMLRHKVVIQAARAAFSFSGIYDEDEASRIIDGGSIDAQPIKEREPVVEAQPVEGDTEVLISEEQAKMITEQIKAKDIPVHEFQEEFKVDSAGELSLAQFMNVVDWLAGK